MTLAQGRCSESNKNQTQMITCAVYLFQDFMAGPEYALEDIRAWTQLNNFAITGKYFDYSVDHPENTDQGLARLELDAEHHEFDIVVIHSTRTFTADQKHNGFGKLQRLVGICAAHAIPVFSISEGQLSVDDLPNWIRKNEARHKSFQQGTYMSAAPYGYTTKAIAERKVLSVDRSEAEVVKEVFQRFLAGDDAISIAEKLNKSSVQPRTGKKWRPRNIVGEAYTTRGIVRNPIYHGAAAFFTQANIRFHDVNARHEGNTKVRILRKHWVRHYNEDLRIICEQDWQAAQKRLVKRDTGVADQAARARRPLYGKIRCAICDAPMKMLQGDRYYCVQGYNGRCIHKRGFSANVAEREALVKLFIVVRGRRELETNEGLRADLDRLAERLKAAINERVSDLKSKEGNDLLALYLKSVSVWPNKTADNERQLAITLIKPIGSVDE